MKLRINNEKKIGIIFIVSLVLLVVVFILNSYGGNMMKKEYERAINLYMTGDADSIEESKRLFEELNGYKDSEQYLIDIDYVTTIDDINKVYHELQKDDLNKEDLNQYSFLLDSINKLLETRTLNKENEEKAISLRNNIMFSYAELLFECEEYEAAMKLFQEVRDSDEGEYDIECKNYLAQITLILYPDAQETIYENAENEFLQHDYETALSIFEKLGDYKDSNEKAENCLRMIYASPISTGIRATFFINDSLQIEYRGDISQSLKDLSDYADPISVSALGTILMVLDADGNVHVYGEITESNKEYLESKDHIIQIATGQQYAVELTSNGKVYAVGHNGDGQCDAENDWKNYFIKEIDCGWRTTVGIDVDGKVHVAGYRKELYEQLMENEEWTDIIHIATGGGGYKATGQGHIVGLRTDKTVVAVGDNEFGQCNTKEWKDVKAIAAGDFHTIGLKEDGTVYITTQDGYKELSFPERIVYINAGTGYSVFLGESGKTYTQEDPYTHQGQVDGIDKWSVHVESKQ